MFDFQTTYEAAGEEWLPLEKGVWVRRVSALEVLVAPWLPARRYWLLRLVDGVLIPSAYDLDYSSLEELDAFVNMQG